MGRSKGQQNAVQPEVLEWERKRFEFFIEESKNRRPQEIIKILDKVLPPPPAWYHRSPDREEQGDTGQ